MPVCPQCNTVLDDDFGMVQCRKCGAVSFLDISGEVATEGPLDGDGPDLSQIGEDAIASDSLADSLENIGLDEGSAEAPSSLAQTEEFEFGDVQQENSEIPEFPSVPMEPRDSIGQGSFEPDGQQFGSEMEGGLAEFNSEAAAAYDLAAIQAPDESGSEDFSDLVEFGNDSVSMGAQGSLLFRVKIAAIDTAETRRGLRESLVDTKFLWDADQLMKTITDGVLIIDRINPVKAAVLVDRLKGLPVEVTWEQYALSQV